LSEALYFVGILSPSQQWVLVMLGLTIDVGFVIIIMTKEGCQVIDGLIVTKLHATTELQLVLQKIYWCEFDQFV